jgi:hypothetical protein
MHLKRLDRGYAKNGLQGAHGKRVVEVLVLIEPLVGKIFLTGVHEGRVVRGQVFNTALNGNEIVSSVINGIVEESETKWLPSLLNFGIGIGSNLQVSINASKNAVSELIESVGKSSVENNLGVGVVREVILESSG